MAALWTDLTLTKQRLPKDCLLLYASAGGAVGSSRYMMPRALESRRHGRSVMMYKLVCKATATVLIRAVATVREAPFGRALRGSCHIGGAPHESWDSAESTPERDAAMPGNNSQADGHHNASS